MFAALDNLREVIDLDTTINESMIDSFFEGCEEAVDIAKKSGCTDRVLVMTINDSIDDSMLDKCEEAAVNAKNAKESVQFDGEVSTMFNNHLNLLHEARYIPSMGTLSEDSIVKDTFVEKVANDSGSESDASTHSEEIFARAPKPNTHGSSNGEDEGERSKTEESSSRRRHNPLGPLQMNLRGVNRSSAQ